MLVCSFLVKELILEPYINILRKKIHQEKILTLLINTEVTEENQTTVIQITVVQIIIEVLTTDLLVQITEEKGTKLKS